MYTGGHWDKRSLKITTQKMVTGYKQQYNKNQKNIARIV